MCGHILRGVGAESHSFSLQTRMETTFGPAFSAVTTITKGEPGSPDQPGPGKQSAIPLPAPRSPYTSSRSPARRLSEWAPFHTPSLIK